MTEHTDEPHVHTITFRDNDGKAYSFDVDCPANRMEEFGEKVIEVGATSMNHVAVDGRPMSFEMVAIRAMVLDRPDLIGRDYMTPENLMKLMVGLGTMEAEAAEA